jgi:putative ABC transport system permease protein
MRTLGANRKFLSTTHILEFTLLGFISGLIAVIISEVIIYALYTYVLKMDFHMNIGLWLVIPLTGAFFVGISGFWGVRKVVNQSPNTVLRNI